VPELAVIVPTRGRPDNIRKVIAAWDFTNAWDDADLILAVDADDPEYGRYLEIQQGVDRPRRIIVHESAEWVPMVHKLNDTAVRLAEGDRYFALGFAGDDHLPQTINWAKAYLAALHELGTGMVYGDDGYQGSNLSTEWAVTTDAVRALGRMVPAPVEHMYCDNSMMDLFRSIGSMKYLPGVRIEHMHPIAKKAETDDQYKRVNSREQFSRDRRADEGWKLRGATADTKTLLALRPERLTRHTLRKERPMPGPIKVPFPKHFKNVRGATPPEIELTLADFAIQVPADQEIVELGVFQGKTSLVLSWGARQGFGAHVTGIDPWNLAGNVYDPPFTDAGSMHWARYHVRGMGYSNHVRLVQGFSHEVAKTWDGPLVGLLFVDGDHTKLGARRDIETWAPHLALGARIAVDDYGHPDWPGVKEAVDELVTEGFLMPVEVYHDRLAVTRLRTPDDDNADAIIGLTNGEPWAEPTITAITSEGVSPSPIEAGPVQEPIEEWDELPTTILDTGESSPALVQDGELEGIAVGKPIEELTIPELKTLAKNRGITLGARKDKRSAIITALIEGK
jgi:hypothetical protein